MDNDKELREQLINFLNGHQSRITFDDALKDFPFEMAGRKDPSIPHSAWEILEHLRIAQFDIYDFSVNPSYERLDWPKDYWPDSHEPESREKWEESIRKFKDDLNSMKDLILNQNTDLFAKIPHGTGQTILREVLILGDHNAYHIGQLLVLKKLYQG